jgi:hypothetical protein
VRRTQNKAKRATVKQVVASTFDSLLISKPGPREDEKVHKQEKQSERQKSCEKNREVSCKYLNPPLRFRLLVGASGASERSFRTVLLFLRKKKSREA